MTVGHWIIVRTSVSLYHKKFNLQCPKCRNVILCFGKKQKDILKIDCPVCLESFKDIFEEVYEEENS